MRLYVFQKFSSVILVGLGASTTPLKSDALLILSPPICKMQPTRIWSLEDNQTVLRSMSDAYAESSELFCKKNRYEKCNSFQLSN